MIPIEPGMFMLQSFVTAQQNVLSLVIIAILVDAAIVGIWYMIGALIGNQRVKGTARGELWQVLGTAIIAGLVIGLLIAFGGVFTTVLSNAQPGNPPSFVPTPLSQYTTSTLCNDMVAYTGANGGQGLQEIGPLLSSLNPGICKVVGSNLGTADPTYWMDYPLAATGVIIANDLNQTATNLNQTFVQEAYLSFLSTLNPTITACFQLPDAAACYPPADGLAIVEIQASFQPLAGLDMIIKSLAAFSTLLYTVLLSFVVQLLFINLLLYAWPLILFIGLVFRATPFTRRLGGLLIAISLGAVAIFPTAFALEYITANSSVAPAQQYSFCGSSIYTYNLNFFQAPSIQGIGTDCGCWPKFGLFFSEASAFLELGPGAIVFWLGSIVNVIWGVIQGIWQTILHFSIGPLESAITTAFNPTTLAIYNPDTFASDLGSWGFGFLGTQPTCYIGSPTNGAEGELFGIMQAYGIIGVSSYFLPILNILITLAAIRGISGLLGGDVNMAGLSRLI